MATGVDERGGRDGSAPSNASGQREAVTQEDEESGSPGQVVTKQGAGQSLGSSDVDMDTTENAEFAGCCKMIPPDKQAGAAVAAERGYAKRLLARETNEYGQNIPGTEDEFPYWDSTSRDLGTQSVGLGVYFNVLFIFQVLMCVMIVMSIPNYVLMIMESDYSEQRVVKVVNGTDGSLISENEDCDRGFNGAGIFAHGTLGAFCSQETASAFSCPTECVFDVSLTAEQETPGQGMTPIGSNWTSVCSANNGEPNCSQHQPCDFLDSSEKECCCREGLLLGDNRVPLTVQLLIFFGHIVYIAWLVYYYYAYTRVSQAIGDEQLTAGDYSIFLTNLPANNIDRMQVGKFFSHYGEVANVCMPYSLGRVVHLEKELTRLERERNELTARLGGRVGGCLDSIGHFLYKVIELGSLKSPESKLEAVKKNLERVRNELRDEEKKRTGYIRKAFVTFNYEMHRVNAMRDQRQGLEDRFRKSNPFTSSGARFRKRSLGTKRAPEPSDVWWENFDARTQGGAYLLRQIVSFLINVLILVAGAFAQQAVEQARAEKREEINRRQARAAVNDDSLDPFDDVQVKYQGLVVASGLVVLIVNLIFQASIQGLAMWERPLTRSDLASNLVLRLSTAQIINAIIPIFVISPENLYDSGGLAEQAFVIQLAAGFGPDLYNLIDPFRFLRRNVFPRYVETQEQMEKLFEPDEFVLAEKYASALKTVGMALLFGPMSPLSYLVGLLGVTSSYFVDKWIAVKRAKAPRKLNADNAEAVHFLLWVLGLAQILMCQQIYLPMKPYSNILVWIAIAVYALAYILPLPRMLGIMRDQELEQTGSKGRAFMDMLRGKRARSDDTEGEGEESEGTVAFGSQEERLEVIHPDHEGLEALAPQAHPANFSEVYVPPLPKHTSKAYREKFEREFKLFEDVMQPDTSLLPGQKPSTGGQHALGAHARHDERVNLRQRRARQGAPFVPTSLQAAHNRPQHGYRFIPPKPFPLPPGTRPPDPTSFNLSMQQPQVHSSHVANPSNNASTGPPPADRSGNASNRAPPADWSGASSSYLQGDQKRQSRSQSQDHPPGSPGNETGLSSWDKATLRT